MGFLDNLFAKPFRVVSPSEAQEGIDRGAVLLDVREPHEWSSGHAPKARHIPLGQLSTRAAELPRNREIYVVCRSGARSARAAKLLSARARRRRQRQGRHGCVGSRRPAGRRQGRPPWSGRLISVPAGGSSGMMRWSGPLRGLKEIPPGV